MSRRACFAAFKTWIFPKWAVSQVVLENSSKCSSLSNLAKSFALTLLVSSSPLELVLLIFINEQTLVLYMGILTPTSFNFLDTLGIDSTFCNEASKAG